MGQCFLGETHVRVVRIPCVSLVMACLFLGLPLGCHGGHVVPCQLGNDAKFMVIFFINRKLALVMSDADYGFTLYADKTGGAFRDLL